MTELTINFVSNRQTSSNPYQPQWEEVVNEAFSIHIESMLIPALCPFLVTQAHCWARNNRNLKFLSSTINTLCFQWLVLPSSMYIIGATVSVDTFYLMGGMVLAYSYMKAHQKGINFNVGLFYLHRYLRWVLLILYHVNMCS